MELSMQQVNSRRDFLKTSTLAAAGAVMPYWFSSQRSLAEAAARSPNERLTIGCIGVGDRWKQDPYHRMRHYGDLVGLCDADRRHLDEARSMVEEFTRSEGREPQIQCEEDYRKILDRKDIDTIIIVTPDHWHSKIAIEAMQAGKDVYCEKPLTLTIHEGKQIIKVLEETKAVFQVGTQQRTENERRFLQAIAIIRAGRIGDIKKVVCDIGQVSASGPLPAVDVPEGLNWDLWLGQAPLVDYRFKDNQTRFGLSNCHYEFRWWYEYSGGKMTDWGAHHVDIAQWALGQNGPGQGPVKIEPVSASHPCAYKDGNPVESDCYNVATDFDVKVTFDQGVEMRIVSQSPDNNGILFEGTKGRFHVSRGGLKGGPVQELESNPLPEGALEEVYGGPLAAHHQENFVECIKTRNRPISDVWTHHKAMTTCHLANIAIRLNESLNWDAKAEEIVGNPQAQSMQKREQRKGYEIHVDV